ncbi:AraC family transcriptional regulator [Acinetobacter lactucae]|uniref:AraC family transcriptional regulator n=1 Tax=Acinetobacter lactucae TaxID=1785128 RepID=UPI0021CD65AC|nr:AraC family transcriptional regulator [Acinetobacter lactucae]MCU4347709.1 AraC family transcriptional regulator [Acinetobacter lactucae]
MDALSHVLSLLRIKHSNGAGLDAGGDWAINFPAYDGIKFNVVLKGQCWVKTQDDEEPFLVKAGDCVLLTRGKPFIAATDLNLPTIESSTIFDMNVGKISVLNGGGDFFLIGISFDFEGDTWSMLTSALPSFVHLKNVSNQVSVLKWAIEQLSIEIKEETLGNELMTSHLAQIMLLQVLRFWLGPGQTRYTGWLAALSDHRLIRSMNVIHEKPMYSWTVAELAVIAGMSRTTFTQHFSKVVGQSPINYLTSWRMQLAADMLLRSEKKVINIAYTVGYQSEAAFSAAFKRMYGHSPTQYRRFMVTK